MAKARVHRAYSQQAIISPAHVGVHFAAVRRMVQRERETARSKACPVSPCAYPSNLGAFVKVLQKTPNHLLEFRKVVAHHLPQAIKVNPEIMMDNHMTHANNLRPGNAGCGDLIPDFILVGPVLQKSMILDLKLPNKRVVFGTKNRRRISAPLEEAKSQLLRYRDWFDDSNNRAIIKERFGMELYRPRIGVVIGRTSEFENEFERQQLASDNPQIEIVTYDDIVEFAKRRILLLQRANRD